MTKFNKVQLLTTQYPTREQRFKFDKESRSICALFARLVRDAELELPMGWGVNAEFVSDQAAPRFVYSSGLHHVWVGEDITVFERLSDLEKKEFFLQKVIQSINLLCQQYQFDVQPFLEVTQKIRELAYVNTWEWRGGRKISPNKQLKSRVFVKHELEYFELNIQVLNKSGRILFETTIRPNEIPDEIIIHHTLGELIWTSESQFEIVSRLKLPQEKPIRVSYVGSESP